MPIPEPLLCLISPYLLVNTGVLILDQKLLASHLDSIILHLMGFFPIWAEKQPEFLPAQNVSLSIASDEICTIFIFILWRHKRAKEVRKKRKLILRPIVHTSIFDHSLSRPNIKTQYRQKLSSPPKNTKAIKNKQDLSICRPIDGS